MRCDEVMNTPLSILSSVILLFRIHDRLRFRKPGDGEEMDPGMFVEGEEGWVIERLAP